MATPGPPQQQQQQPQPPPTNDSLPPALSWEGEKMFNIYIYDYCFKRGFRKTARELMSEADIAPDSTPPINARQGLLFEWWSVFWVLFTAKANGSGTEEAMLYTQIMAIPQVVLAQLKQELGMGDKDLSTFNAQDKNRLLSVYRQRHAQQQGKLGQDNATAGPSNLLMQPPGQQGQQRGGPQQRGPGPQPGQPGPQGQQLGQQRVKRNSTSPGEEHENLPRNESSPPDRKRVRRSPMEQPAVPTMNNVNFPHGAPLQQGPPQQMMNMGPQGMMIRGAPPGMGGMNGHPGQGGTMGGLGGMGMQGGPGPQGMQSGPGQPGMHGMGPQMGHSGGVTPLLQHQQMQAREHMMRQHAMLAAKSGPGNAASPSLSEPTSFTIAPPQGGGGPGFGPGANRIGQKATMMPPPSPAMGGPPKDPNQNPGPGAPNNNGGKNPNQPGGMPANHGSPRNPPPGNGGNAGHTPNANGTGPPTPGPQNPNPASQPGGLGVGGGPQNMAPSPSAILGGGGNGGGQPMNNASMGGQLDMGGNIFGADWINGVANGLEDFGDINFERDFGQWFNPDDVPGLDGMK
ncbi:hypothetical protein DXG03_001620 [Asterophora parasitica]|uniref:LisH domain-containing protein n=1 Tax=Asterophora parasitica TaxID=117018 RepID=A0A9P7KA79_9AGAR|nr:hypothetical protein DXG03_001620 [Asterophora parasitica]